MNDVLTWILDAVQSVDPVLRTALAGIAIMLETSVLIGLIVPGDTIVIVVFLVLVLVAKKVIERVERKHLADDGTGSTAVPGAHRVED